MKIAQIGNQFIPCIGGVEKVMETICEKSKYENSVITLNKCKESNKKLKKEEKIGKTEIYRMNYLDLKYYKIAPQILKKIKNFDLVCVHGIGFFSDYLIATKFIHNKPVVVITHGGIFHTKNINFLKKIYFKLIQRILLRFPDKVIAVSKNDYKLFSEIVNKNKLKLIENGIDYSKYSKGKKKKKNQFIYYGRLSKNKKIENIIETFNELNKKNKKWRLLIIGKDFDDIEKNLKKQVKKFNLEKKIQFLGEIKETKLINKIKESEFFVSASEYEGFGLSLIESMAAKTIPLVEKNNSFRILLKDKKNGFFIEFENPKKASIEINKIIKLKQEKKDYIKKNSEEFAKQFDWSKKIKEYDKLYSNLVSG